MGGKRYKPEEIITKLRESEVFRAEGVSICGGCPTSGRDPGDVLSLAEGLSLVAPLVRATMAKGGMKVDQAKRLKDLEKENARLKRLLADAELDKAILKEAASGNW